MKEVAIPPSPNLTGPLGWNGAIRIEDGEVWTRGTDSRKIVSARETITGTGLPFGGHKVDGFAERLTTRGVRSMFTGSFTRPLLLLHDQAPEDYSERDRRDAK